jgi:hypothetical protein
MKKSDILPIAILIALLLVIFTGCTLQSSNPIKTSPTQTIQNTATLTPKPGRPVFVPFVSSADSTADTQADPAQQATADTLTPPPTIEPSLPTATPGKPPTPTLFWPTPANLTFSTPYVRPSGTHGENLPPEKWQEWPVLPVVSDHAFNIYRAGIDAGHDPAHFSKVGDCQNIRQYFLGMFDSPGRFQLGDKYAYLQKTIDHFSGSWVRISEAVRTGFNVASVLTPLYANPKNCKPGETPLDCEFRIWNPSIVIISMETWTAGRPVQMYDNYLRQIVEYAIAHKVLPILATKADNLEGDNSINLIIARVAHDYDIPLWNFWAASYPLPDHGLTEDGFHLTNGPTFLDSPDYMKLGWPVRNATALETIDKVWNAVK